MKLKPIVPGNAPAKGIGWTIVFLNLIPLFGIIFTLNFSISILYFKILSKIGIFEKGEQNIGTLGNSIINQGSPDKESFLVSVIKIPFILWDWDFK